MGLHIHLNLVNLVNQLSMSWKTFIFVILVIFLGVFMYLKFQVMGSPDSGFNRGLRFKLGRNSAMRTILGIHKAGDERAEFLGGQGPIAIEWFKPQGEDVDKTVLQKFADLVGKYTGRTTVVNLAGPVGDSTMDIATLKSFVLKADGEKPKGSTLLAVAFVKDFSPQTDRALSTTYQESSVVISLDGHANFLPGLSREIYNNYLLASLLHEFGHQIGLSHNQDQGCIMNEHTGTAGKPLELYGWQEPQDFCQAEQSQINQLKAQYQ